MNKLNKILIVVLALQALLIMGMRMTKDDSQRKPIVAELFAGVEADKITKLDIFGPPAEAGKTQSSVSLTKDGAKWVLPKADAFPADASKVDDFLKKLVALKSRTLVVTTSSNHDRLEVSEKKYQRKVVFNAGGEDRTLFVGSSPSFKNLHVRLGGKDDVYLVTDLATSDVGDKANTWINRTYVEFPEKDIWALTIENAKGRMQFEKNPQDLGWMPITVQGQVKKTELDQLLQKAAKISAEAPISKGEKPDQGFATALATVTLVTGTSTIAGMPPKSTETHTIRVGKKDAVSNQYFVKASTSDYVVKAASWAIDPLVQKSNDDLLEKPEEKK